MEYIYAAMLLNSAKQDINETSVKKVLDAAGVTPDNGRVKALVASLEGVDIEGTIKEAASLQVVTPSVSVAPAESRKEEEKDEKKDETQAAQGLGALFG